VIGRARHLQEQRLYDCYYAEESGEAIDPRAAEHLADCAACGARYAELSRFLDALRAEGDAESHEVFTTERLQAQRQQIARRIEHAGHPARVISFPARLVRRSISSTAAPTAPRWIAAAAAAGLFVGVALGASYEWDWRSQAARPMLSGDATGRVSPIATRGSGFNDVAADDAFLSELELALDRPRTRELIAYDALTPHVRSVRDQR
jgi:hypothetical protein